MGLHRPTPDAWSCGPGRPLTSPGATARVAPVAPIAPPAQSGPATTWIRRAFRSRLLQAGGTAIGLLLLVRGVNLSQAAAVLGHADVRLELLGVFLTGLGLGCAVIGWTAIAAATGTRVPFPRVASWYLQGVFVGQVTPTGAGGDASRAASASSVMGPGRGVASLAASRLAGSLSMALFGLAGAVLAEVDFGVPVVLAAAGYVLAMLAAWWLALGAHSATAVLQRSGNRILASVGRRIAPMTEALAGFRRTPGALGWCVGMAIVGCLLNIFAMQTFAAAVGLHQPASTFAVVVPISLIATMTPFAINGIGLREGVLVGLLVHLGASAARAAALALLVDVQLLPFALVGAGLLMRSRRRARAPVLATLAA